MKCLNSSGSKIFKPYSEAEGGTEGTYVRPLRIISLLYQLGNASGVSLVRPSELKESPVS